MTNNVFILSAMYPANNEDELYLNHANFPILNNNIHTINIPVGPVDKIKMKI
jgi:hypothetical protein